jgi:hypothetical protein
VLPEPPAAEPPTAPLPPTAPPALAGPPAAVGPTVEPPTAVEQPIVPPMFAPPESPWQAPTVWPPASYAGQQAPGYPPGWAGAAPPPPPGFLYPGIGAPAPKRSRTPVIVTAVAAVVILACLGFGTATFFAVRHVSSGETVSASGPTDLPTDFPTDDPTGDPTPDADPTHDGDLKQYVIGRPSTARTWPKVKAEQALNLTSAAANFADPAEAQLILQRYGFKDGYTRRWIDKHGSYITVRVLRFTDAGGGDNFASFYIDANQAGGWGTPQEVPGVPNAAGFVKPKKEKNGFQRSLAVGDAADIVAIVLADQLPPASPSTPDATLSDEFNLL